jgi:4-amino-4-deoxy-L-arabinose transferase-like glycosyltransferase
MIAVDRPSKLRETACVWTLLVLLSALILSIVVLAAVPPVDRDALTHHLAVPKLYIKHGGIHEIPYVPFSYYPMNLDLLYLIPLYFGNDIFPKYIHFAFALFTAGLIFSYLHRRLGRATDALLGVVLFLSLPVVIKLSITVYVDLGLVFFSTAALLQLLRWSETGFRPRHLVLSGIFAGLCLGTKPNGMLTVFLLSLAVPVMFQRAAVGQGGDRLQDPNRQDKGSRRALQSLAWAASFVVVAAVVYSPWMIRNYAWTGNPVYPMAQSIFAPNGTAGGSSSASDAKGAEGTETGDGQEKSALSFGHFAGRKMIFGETLPEILAIPLRVFFQGQDDNPRLFDGRLNPYLLVFPLAAVLVPKGRRRSPQVQLEIQMFGAFSLISLTFAFFLVDMRIRYIAPIIPPLVILAVIGINDLIDIIKSRLAMMNRWLALSAAGALFLGLLGLNVAYLVEQFSIVDPMSYLKGKLSRDEYIQKYRPEYTALSFANNNLPEGTRILSLFNGNRIYYSEREMICDNEYFRKTVHASQSSADLIRRLDQRGITHLLVRLDIFKQWADIQFKPFEKFLLQSLFDEKLLRLYQGHGYALFELKTG